MTRELMQGRLLRFMSACAAVYAVAALFVDAPIVILVLNGIAVSIASGVCVAYTPIFLSALRERRPTKAGLLGAGIFSISLTIFGMRVLSIVARDLGWPGVYNTHWFSAAIFTGCIGGLLHLWAPNAVEGRIPRERWAHTGALVAIGIFIVVCLWDRHFSAIHPLVELR